MVPAAAKAAACVFGREAKEGPPSLILCLHTHTHLHCCPDRILALLEVERNASLGQNPHVCVSRGDLSEGREERGGGGRKLDCGVLQDQRDACLGQTPRPIPSPLLSSTGTCQAPLPSLPPPSKPPMHLHLWPEAHIKQLPRSAF